MINITIKDKKKSVTLIVIVLISFFILTRVTTSPKFYTGMLEKLDEKKTTVMELTAAAAATSTAITLIPDDVATPIAEKIADTSSYFLIVLCVLFLEKYLLTLSGYITFGVLVPLGCILFLFYIHTQKNILREYGKKVIIIGVALFAIIPVSVGISSAVETAYQDSIEQTLVAAENSTKELENSIDENKEDKGFFEEIWDNIKGGVSGFTDRVENLLSRFVEAVAVLLVTNCIIPILAAAIFIWGTKILLVTKATIN